VGMAYNCVVSTGSAWFAHKPGTITGILMMAFGCGSLIFAPLDNFLLASVGWSRTFLYLGIAFLLVAAVCGKLICMPPEDYSCPPPKKKECVSFGVEYTTPQMLRRASFWLLLVWAIAVAVVGYSGINQVFMIASSIGLSDVAASFAVSIVSVGNGLSRIISGKVFDEKGGGWEMGMISVLLLLSMACLLPAIRFEKPVLLFVGMALFGMGFGGGSPTIANFVRSFYGSENFAMNYSMLNFNSVVASVISQFISGHVLNVSGSYYVMMLWVAAVVLIVSGMNLLIRKP